MTFQTFLSLLEPLRAKYPEAEFEVSEPAAPSGFWILSIDLPDGFFVEVEWKRPLGFGIAAGPNLAFGEGVHEVFANAPDAAARVAHLVATRTPTSADVPVSIAQLRKLRGRMQKEVAEALGISKSGLSQIETSAAIGTVQIDTLQKLIESLGGRLKISATFPDGTERRVSVGH